MKSELNIGGKIEHYINHWTSYHQTTQIMNLSSHNMEIYAFTNIYKERRPKHSKTYSREEIFTILYFHIDTWGRKKKAPLQADIIQDG